MAANPKNNATAMEIDRLAMQLAKDPQSKVFLPLAEEYCKAGMWQEAAGVLEDGLKYYPGFITAMVVLGRAYDQMGQATKAKAILEEAVKLSPENLRAHRTLIKIYIAQGQSDAAVRSCDVILGLNPRDEEALSIRAKLGRPVKEAEPKPRTAPVAKPRRDSTLDRQPPPDPEALPGVQAQQTGEAFAESEVQRETEVTPFAMAETIMESALQANDQQTSASTEPIQETVSPQSSPHSGAIAQLESFRRSIEKKRKDRGHSGKTSSSTF